VSQRLCYALDLIDDAALIADYEAAHAPGAVWPGVIAGIRASGYESLEIWRTGDRLMMIAEVAADWPRPLDCAAVMLDRRWQSLMDRFQKRLATARPDEKWAPMVRIFSLDEQ
jgi:L-rhamnose mutarotase